MDIIIGSLPLINQTFPEKLPPKKTNGMVEAQLLHVRKPRKGVAGPSGVERRGSREQDPANGRVLTIMVPDAAALPKDIDSNDYQVMLRFAKK